MMIFTTSQYVGAARAARSRNRAWLWKFLAASGSALALSSCAVGPDFVRPTAPQIDAYTAEPLPKQTAAADTIGGAAQHFAEGSDIPALWWEVFRSKPLNALIEQALKANPTLKAAEAALRVAQENVYAQRGVYYPSVNANLSPSRQRVSGTLSSPLSSPENVFNLHTAQLTVSYAIDVFGTNRRQVEALQAQAGFQRFQLEAAHLSLTSNVVATVIQMASLRAQIDATESTVQLLDEQRKLFSRQLELGAIPEVNLIAQEATLAQTRATLPPLKKLLAQQQNLLAVLTGRYPSELANMEFNLADLQLPEELPVSLPSTLVQYRPDVRASEEQLHAASAQVGVAVANMFPQLTLTGGVGSTAPAVAELFTSGANFWSLAGSLTQPIFQGGTLLHRKRSAEAAYEQAANQYRSTVLSAFQDVANTLYALRFDAETLAAALDAERLTFRTFEIVRRQVELGDTSYLALLSAEQAYQQARINLTLAQANRFADTAALFQALGGGWWNRAGALAKN